MKSVPGCSVGAAEDTLHHWKKKSDQKDEFDWPVSDGGWEASFIRESLVVGAVADTPCLPFSNPQCSLLLVTPAF